jgi:hypothetical protein
MAVFLYSYTWSTPSIFLLSRVGVSNPSAGMHHELLSLDYLLNVPLKFIFANTFFYQFWFVYGYVFSTKVYLYAKTGLEKA